MAKAFRAIVSQRLIPSKAGSGRVPVVEILKVHPDTIAHLEIAGLSREDLLQVIKDGAAQGMQHFDGEIEKLVRQGTVDLETALGYASDREALRQALES